VIIVSEEMKCHEMKEGENIIQGKRKHLCRKVESENEGQKLDQTIQVRQKGDREGKQRRLMIMGRCRRGGSHKKYNVVSLVVRCGGL